MPKPPLPEELQEFLRAPNPCVVASVRSPDEELHATATWYEWTDSGTVLLNMDGSRRRLEYMRNDPRVALTILADDWYSHVSLTGRVREIRPDPDLTEIDRISRHYTGRPYPDRDRDSWTAEVQVERWHSWGDLARDRAG
jgi:PPOX class probable F420-dependent enzyme